MTKPHDSLFVVACVIIAFAMAGLFWLADLSLSLWLTEPLPSSQRNAPAVANDPAHSTSLLGARGHNFNYVQCDVPEGMTLTQWRRAGCPTDDGSGTTR